MPSAGLQPGSIAVVSCKQDSIALSIVRVGLGLTSGTSTSTRDADGICWRGKDAANLSSPALLKTVHAFPDLLSRWDEFLRVDTHCRMIRSRQPDRGKAVRPRSLDCAEQHKTYGRYISASEIKIEVCNNKAAADKECPIRPTEPWRCSCMNSDEHLTE
jgi:hypothetical protein